MKKRLLVVDDSEPVRVDLRSMVESADYEVVGEAGDGAQAVALYRKLKPDLVLMDLLMPVLNGIEAARQIRDFDPEARIIAVSGLVQPSVQAATLDVGMIALVPKPVEERDLLAELAAAFPPL